MFSINITLVYGVSGGVVGGVRVVVIWRHEEVIVVREYLVQGELFVFVQEWGREGEEEWRVMILLFGGARVLMMMIKR